MKKRIIGVMLVCIILLSTLLMAGCNSIMYEWGRVRYANVSEIVYAANDITELENKRGKISVDIKKGEELIRIGYDEDWSKIKYNDEEFYVKTEMLTEENPAETTPEENPVETTPDGDPVESVEFEDVNEIVYATQNVNVRSSTSTEADNKVGQVKAGTELKRIGYHEEWSKVLYNGEACYIKSEYLTTEKEEATIPPSSSNDEFIEVNETVYIFSDQDDDGKCDGRCGEAGQNTVITYFYPAPVRENSKYAVECGTQLIRTGILIENAEKGYGWSRVIYNGEELYVRNSCITTEKPHQ